MTNYPEAELFFRVDPKSVCSQVLADVTLALPVDGPFTYLVPPELGNKVRPGMRVQVPFRNREMAGYVVGIREEAPKAKQIGRASCRERV